MNTWSWKQSPELMDRLIKAQNALHTPIDIVTFAGFCGSEAALAEHVERYEKRVAEQAPIRRRAPRLQHAA